MLQTRVHLDERSARFPRGFTVVELLIVVAIVILLLSILIVAVNQAVKGAQSANSKSLMNAINQALITFKGDHGYLPPVLNDERGLEFTFGASSFTGPNPADADYAADMQTWFSITTLAEYLIGYGRGDEDGYGDLNDTVDDNGTDYDGEIPTTGIRSPGPDGVWGATLYSPQDGTLEARNPNPQITAAGGPGGRRFGPYLELKDERLLGGIDPNGNIVFPGEDPAYETYHKVIVDYWGTPIRYYRTPYPPGGITQSYNKTEVTTGWGHKVPVPTLADVFVLRSYEIDPDNQINGLPDMQLGIDPKGDPTTSRFLMAAEFAIFSEGPDAAATDLQRVDDDEFNRDNIVEVGP